MKYILTIAICIYWRAWPTKNRRACLFRDNCSHHVYRVTTEDGLIAGIRAFLRRFKVCRKGYTVIPVQTGIGIRLVDGSVITSDQASPTVLAPFQMAMHEVEQRLKARD